MLPALPTRVGIDEQAAPFKGLAHLGVDAAGDYFLIEAIPKVALTCMVAVVGWVFVRTPS